MRRCHGCKRSWTSGLLQLTDRDYRSLRVSECNRLIGWFEYPGVPLQHPHCGKLFPWSTSLTVSSKPRFPAGLIRLTWDGAPANTAEAGSSSSTMSDDRGTVPK